MLLTPLCCEPPDAISSPPALPYPTRRPSDELLHPISKQGRLVFLAYQKGFSMITRIDWISFSVLVTPAAKPTELTAYSAAMIEFHALFPDALGVLVDNRRWKSGKGRAPYNASFQHEASKITLFCHPTLPHALFEISGQGCEWLAKRNMLYPLLAAVQKRVTRLDIACDMETTTTPEEFAEARDTERFRSHGHIISESGSTYYVGSRSSDRYARVYRYNPPHERAHLLRCEMVIKAEQARAAVEDILWQGLSQYASGLGAVFKWQHKDWQPQDMTAAAPPSWRPERREGKTLFWLADTIAPLLARLHREGVIDIIDWTEKTVLPLINPTQPE